MALSVRLFGLSSWSILVPQALMGVASVGLLHATVRRTSRSAVAGLLAGAVLALTPVALLMFRFDNPDALLVLLLVGSVASTVRALESSRLRAEGLAGHPVRWLALAGALVGFAFLTKMLQAFLVLPALALVYLLAAHTPIGKRIGHLLVAFGSMVVAAGWWIAIVELWPASVAPLHRRVADQLHPRAHPRLQRLRPAHRRRDRLGRRRWRRGRRELGLDRHPAAVRLGDRRPGRVAGPGRPVLLGAGLWFTRRAARTDLTRAGLSSGARGCSSPA